MLIRFEVANFRSILEPAELSMVAVDVDRPEARPVASLGASLLPVAAIYGPNASGKTNVIEALQWLVDAVADSLRFWDDSIPIERFAFLDGGDRPSEFTVEMEISGVRFEYVVELDDREVVYEALFHYPEKKRRRIFEREGLTLKLQRGLGAISGTRELLTDRVLVLTIARRFDEPLVGDFSRQLLDVQSIGTWRRRARMLRRPATTGAWFDGARPASQPETRGRALALLRLADLGIEDVVIDKVETQDRVADLPVQRTRVRMVHNIRGTRGLLELVAESEGTRTWYRLIGPILTALEAGSLLVLDELDASLHPTLSAQLIRLFADPATNPEGAQLIFTSHDTSLLNHLNRDEVWLTEKGEDGATRLGALAEFAGERVRRSQNLEKAYLHGRFGAIPDVDRTDFLRSLGLIG